MKLIRTAITSLLLASFAVVGIAHAQDEVVVIAQTVAHSSLNPAEATGIADYTVMRTIYEGLVGFDENFELVPELATSWEVNEEATVFDFTLREGVTFHDGTAFDAEAAKAYFDWVLDEDNSIPARGQSVLSDIESVEVVGPFELRITLSVSNGTMLSNLALANSRIASPASVIDQGPSVTRNPVGTGPYQFVEWIDGQKIVLEAFDDYWGDPAGADGMEFLATTNASTRAAQLQSGEAHFIEAVPAPLVPQIEAADGVSVVVAGSAFARIFPVNTQVAPFDDLRVRQAMNYAIDKQVIAEVGYGGRATIMDAPFPASVFGYAPQEPYAYDPERARELLAEAGFEDGFTFSVLTFTGDEYATVGQLMQQMFAEVGLDMRLNPTERGALVDAIFQPFESTELEASLVGSATRTGDADQALTVSYYSESWPPASNNWSFYANDRVDELIRAGRQTGDVEERRAIYAEAQEIIWNDAPWVYLVSPDNVGGVADELTGVIYMPDRSVDARRASLD